MLHEELISTVQSEENVFTQCGLNFPAAEADAVCSQGRRGLVVRCGAFLHSNGHGVGFSMGTLFCLRPLTQIWLLDTPG